MSLHAVLLLTRFNFESSRREVVVIVMPRAFALGRNGQELHVGGKYILLSYNANMFVEDPAFILIFFFFGHYFIEDIPSKENKSIIAKNIASLLISNAHHHSRRLSMDHAI